VFDLSLKGAHLGVSAPSYDCLDLFAGCGHCNNAIGNLL
jgi:hypothetical protein